MVNIVEVYGGKNCEVLVYKVFCVRVWVKWFKCLFFRFKSVEEV